MFVEIDAFNVRSFIKIEFLCVFHGWLGTYRKKYKYESYTFRSNKSIKCVRKGEKVSRSL